MLSRISQERDFMKTRFGALVVALATLLPTGCKMCCPSYDYCSPTNPGESQSEWCGKERRGSILGGYTSSGYATSSEQEQPGEAIDESPAPPEVQQPAPQLKPLANPPMKPTGFSRSQASASARRTR